MSSDAISHLVPLVRRLPSARRLFNLPLWPATRGYRCHGASRRVYQVIETAAAGDAGSDCDAVATSRQRAAPSLMPAVQLLS